ncbi:MAG: DUF493 family protein [Bdellovibrionales bacterium]|nr:DUF493 family protein [Bdellovibrionales bacterium]
MQDFAKIRAMLEAQEQFPMDYLHKVIGRNTTLFTGSIERLERKLPALRREGIRQSASQNHVSVTWILRAQNADEIIALLQETQCLEDLVMVL